MGGTPNIHLMEACYQLARNPKFTDLINWDTRTELNKWDMNNYNVALLSFFLRNNKNLKRLGLRLSLDDKPGVVILKDFLKTLMRNSSIESLELRLLEKGNEVATELSELLKSNVSRIRTLNLSNSNICKDGIMTIVEGLKNNNTVEKLILSQTNFGDEWSCTFAHPSPGEIKLKYLDLSESSIGKYGAPFLYLWLCHNNTLQELDLSDTGIYGVDAQWLRKMLEENTTLKTLRLDCNHIGDSGAEAIGVGLLQNSSLTKLDLSFNGISNAGLLPIAEAMRVNNSLTSLGLMCDAIGGDGLVALAAALHTNKSLSELHLCDTKINEKGMTALTDMLLHNSTLRSIDISSNGIKNVRGLCTALMSENTALTELDLGRNPLGVDGAILVAETISNNSPMKKLSLSVCEIGDDGLETLCERLKSTDHSIEHLDLSGDDISLQSYPHIGEMLAHERCLKTLFLFSRKDINSCVTALADGLKRNNSLKRLDVGCEGEWNETGLLAMKEVLKDNFLLEEIGDISEAVDGAEALHRDVDFHFYWNKQGRYLLNEQNVPLSLWANVMSHVGPAFEPDVIYGFLREKPDLCEQDRREE